MTKHLSIILSLIMLMSVSAAKASTLYYVVVNIRYAVNTDDSTAMVATYSTYKGMTEITIPKHYGERVCLPCDFARRILFQRVREPDEHHHLELRDKVRSTLLCRLFRPCNSKTS